MTTSYNWAYMPETNEAFLTVPEGQYVIKKHGFRLYRAFFNDEKTEFFSHSIEGVKEQVTNFLRGEDLPKAHSQGGFSI